MLRRSCKVTHKKGRRCGVAFVHLLRLLTAALCRGKFLTDGLADRGLVKPQRSSISRGSIRPGIEPEMSKPRRTCSAAAVEPNASGSASMIIRWAPHSFARSFAQSRSKRPIPDFSDPARQTVLASAPHRLFFSVGPIGGRLRQRSPPEDA